MAMLPIARRFIALYVRCDGEKNCEIGVTVRTDERKRVPH